MCARARACTCMYRRPIVWDTIFSYMHLCTEWMYLNSSSLIKESLQKEAIRSMAVNILTTNTSLVNGTSNTTQMSVIDVGLSFQSK